MAKRLAKFARLLSGIDTAYIGPFAARRMMNGDSITLKVESYYRTHDNNASLQPALTASQSQTALLKQVVAGLVNAGQGSTTAQLLADTTLQNSVSSYLNALTVASGKPQAGVYYISLDQQLKYVAAGSGFSQVGSGGCGIINPTIPKATSNGYFFIFVANQTPQLFVYWDNLQMAHIHSPVLEETSYYPFGLTMAGISSKASGSLENKLHKFNGWEKNEDLDLNVYESFYRTFDYTTNRSWQVDPKIEDGDIGMSPYAMMSDNPVSRTDPLGDIDWSRVRAAVGNTIHDVGVAALGAVNAYSSDNVGGVGRVDAQTKLGEDDRAAFKVGQMIGDVGAIISSAVESVGSGAAEVVSGGNSFPGCRSNRYTWRYNFCSCCEEPDYFQGHGPRAP